VDVSPALVDDADGGVQKKRVTVIRRTANERGSKLFKGSACAMGVQ